MKYHCVVCANNKENIDSTANLSYFRFPKCEAKRKFWIESLNFKDVIKTTSRVCQKHFKASDMNPQKNHLKPDAIPGLNIKEIPVTNRALKSTLNVSNSSSQPQVTSPCCSLNNAITKESAREATYLTSSVKKLKKICDQRLGKIKKLKEKVKTLQAENRKTISVEDVFPKNLPMQRLIISQIERFKKRSKPYSDEERATSLSLYYSCGSNGYRTLLKLGFRLPSCASLKRWTSGFHLSTGINSCIMKTIANLTSQFNDREKDCIIMWDEMSTKEFIEYEKHSDCFEGIVDFGLHGRKLEASTEALVFMIHGITSNWRFPVSYYFSRHATSSEMLGVLLKENISAISAIGLNIRMGICDMSFTNQSLYNNLGVSLENPFVIIDSKKVYLVHDAPHLIKLVRNNLMKHTFTITSALGKASKAKWSHIVSFYRKDKKLSSRMAPKLTDAHIFLKDYSKMRVKLATQVLSNFVYAGITAMAAIKLLGPSYKETASLVRKFDEIFDILNISSYSRDKPNRTAKSLFDNLDRFDNYFQYLSSITLPLRRKSEFLYGLKLTLSGVKELCIDLKGEGYEFVLTRRLQQDSLEHFFSAVRARGGFCRNPTGRQFRVNFRYLFLSTLIHVPTSGNTEVNCESSFVKYFGNISTALAKWEDKRDVSDSVLGDQAVNLSEKQCNSSSLNFYSSHFLTKSFKLMKQQESVVAAYIGAASIYAISRKHDCDLCRSLLKSYAEEGSASRNILIKFKEFDPANPKLGYLDNEEYAVFFHLNHLFVNYASITLNDDGRNVLSGIITMFKSDRVVLDWLEKDPCINHRNFIINYFLRAKMFRLIRDKNDEVKQIKSWSQTRRDLRNQ